MTEILRKRFEENMYRHPGMDWLTVEARLAEEPAALDVLKRMEDSGGEPDTIGLDEASGKIIFCDCSKETPSSSRRK